MSDFKWNETKEHVGRFWDSGRADVDHCHMENRSDRSVINHPGGFEYRVTIEALCRVVSELVAIEESRNKE
jgi:hypothetical protein